MKRYDEGSAAFFKLILKFLMLTSCVDLLIFFVVKIVYKNDIGIGLITNSFFSISLIVVTNIINVSEANKVRESINSDDQKSEVNGYSQIQNENNVSVVGEMLVRNSRSALKYIAIICLLVSYYFIAFEVDMVVMVLLISAMFLIFLQNLLMIYRVRRGFYGGDEEDAREIIAFMLKHADVDGGGPGGRRRELISAEDLKEIRERALAPNIPGGVTQPS